MYRGYVYDRETKLYYLNSRYYDPETGRFLNTDIYPSTGQGVLGHNMFAYCRNNPVCRKDISGTTDVEILDDDSSLLDHDKVFSGGQMGGEPGAFREVIGGENKNSIAYKVHGNSKASTNPQHGYEIYNTETGDVVKTGISGQKLNLNGTSPRANSQVNKLNSSIGKQLYEARIVTTNMSSRQVALEWEKMNALRQWNGGNSMFLHKRPRPWEDRKCY